MYIKITLDYDVEDDDGSYDDECGYCKYDRGVNDDDAGNSNNTAVVPRLLPTYRVLCVYQHLRRSTL